MKLFAAILLLCVLGTSNAQFFRALANLFTAPFRGGGGGGSTCLGDPDSGTTEPRPPKPLAMMNFSPLTVDVTQTKELENCAFPSVNFVQKVSKFRIFKGKLALN